MREEIKKIIKKAISGLYSDFNDRADLSISVEAPKETIHGDYATNVALALSKKLGKNPVEVAKEIISKIGKQKFIEKIEVAGPGFINFYLAKEVFVENIQEILKDKKTKGLEYGKKVIVEYTDPNPFKVFHIGHLMSNAIGESIARIFEYQGAKVKRANYFGDVGLHVAKAIYGKMENPLYPWQDSYVFGARAHEEDESAKKQIEELNKKIYEKSDKQINALYAQGKKESLLNFEKIYKKLGTKFDYYFPESQVADVGKKIVQENTGKVFEKGERGAIIFKGEKFGLHTRVFVNSEGLPTYEAKDLALPVIKYKKYNYEKSVIVTATEQSDYFKVMLCALKQINPELEGKTKHIGHGMLRLPEGKMSSRTGKVVTGESLIDKVKELVLEKVKGRDFSEKERADVSEKVAVGALKYSILKQSIGSDIIYDFEKSISFEGDSGAYLQYSYARAQSVLRKAKVEKVKTSLKNVPREITQLEKMMIRFPEAVEKAGTEYEPHFIALYLTELAREFNNYYAHNKIVDKADELSPYKVALTQAFSITMKNGLWLLGIQAPEKM